MSRRALLFVALLLGLVLSAGLALASPALAAPPVPHGVSMEGRTSTTVAATAVIESDSPVTFYFEYGTTTAYGNQTPSAQAESLPGRYEARQTIPGLSSGTQYHVRVVATNASATVEGPDSLIMTEDADTDGDGVPDHIDACPTVPGPNNGCPQPDADGDGTPDNVDSCPNTPGTGGMLSGCPPPGAPTLRTEPVQITSGGVLFGASGNPNGTGGRVSFEVSLTQDFKPRADVDGPSQTICLQKTGASADVSSFPLGGSRPSDAWYRNDRVTCTPNSERALKPIFDLGYPNGYARYTRRYVRAVLNYSDATGERAKLGGVQTYVPPDRFSGGGSAGRIISALSKSLLPKGKKARIGAILKAGSFPAPFSAPSAGKAQIVWTARGAAKSAARKPVVVAKGSKRVGRAGKVKIKVRLTKKGRRLLKRSKRVKLVARGSFTPSGGKKVSKKRKITLKR